MHLLPALGGPGYFDFGPKAPPNLKLLTTMICLSLSRLKSTQKMALLRAFQGQHGNTRMLLVATMLASLQVSFQFSPSHLPTAKLSAQKSLLAGSGSLKSACSRSTISGVRMQEAASGGISRRQLGQIGLGGLAVVGSRYRKTLPGLCSSMWQWMEV
jgi:hypothetical protein